MNAPRAHVVAPSYSLCRWCCRAYSAHSEYSLPSSFPCAGLKSGFEAQEPGFGVSTQPLRAVALTGAAYIAELEARVVTLCALIDDLHHTLGKRAPHATPEMTAACVKDWILDAKHPVEPVL